jgi:serpin B
MPFSDFMKNSFLACAWLQPAYGLLFILLGSPAVALAQNIPATTSTASAATAPTTTSPVLDLAARSQAVLVDDNNTFAFNLYHQLATAPGDNVFFSPYSISTALVMTWAGARGQTDTQMEKVLAPEPLPLHPTPPVATAGESAGDSAFIASAFGNLQKQLNDTETKSGVTLAVANSLWPQQDHPILPDYLNLIENSFGSGVFPVDYKTAANDAITRINTWVGNQTSQRITNLLQPGDVGASTRLVLVNAIYFKGNWAEQFDAKATLPGNFTLAGGATKPVSLMHKNVKGARFADLSGETTPLKIIALPYKDDALEFVALLPNSPEGLPALEKNLSAAQLTTWLGKLSQASEVEVFLPKFKLTQRYPLVPPLKAMGISDAFTQDADFSGIDGVKDLFIGQVVHQAYVEVNEEGTEAAAATAVGMTAMAMRVTPVFRADHPFIFLIRDPVSGSILFLGRLTTPAE